jgi:hypothetical protein
MGHLDSELKILAADYILEKIKAGEKGRWLFSHPGAAEPPFRNNKVAEANSPRPTFFIEHVLNCDGADRLGRSTKERGS